MIDRQLYDNFKEILRSELIPALGCTEPGAIAYGASQARSLLGSMPESMELWCSGNIVKNVKGVIVPNSGGMRGIEAAAVLGMLAGHSQPDDCDLEVLNSITCDDISEAEKLLKEGFCQCHLAEDTPNLYIKVLVRGNGHEAQIIIEGSHTNITGRILDGKPIYSSASCSGDDMAEKLKDHLSVKKILQFAEALTEKDGRELFSAQIRDNTAIAEEGLSGNYGARVGQTLLKTRDEGSVRARAVAKAAAGSDARMNGCTLPVVINSGQSGHNRYSSRGGICKSRWCGPAFPLQGHGHKQSHFHTYKTPYRKALGFLRCRKRFLRKRRSGCLSSGRRLCTDMQHHLQHTGQCRRHSLRRSKGLLCGKDSIISGGGFSRIRYGKR